ESDWADSFGPALMAVAQLATVCGPASSRTVWSPPFANDGASLTGLTVRRKARDVAPSLEPFRLMVIVVEPDRLAAGVICTVRSGSLPVMEMLASGTKVLSLEVAETDETVWSPTKKVNESGVSSFVA